MTANPLPLYLRMKAEDDGFVGTALGVALTRMSHALYYLGQNPRLAEDYAQVLEDFCDSLDLPNDGKRPSITFDADTPVDARPMRVRLEEYPEAAELIQGSLKGLALLYRLVSEEKAKHAYLRALIGLWAVLGIPTGLTEEDVA